MRPFLYDFKRSFLRLSTLLLLVLFTLAGVGLTALVSSSLSSITPDKYSYVGYADVNGTNLQIVGLGIGPSGNPQQGLNVTVGVIIGNEIKYFSTITNSSGMF
nr:hypothetical protein [Candidatus Aramenus sulfurataquae]